MLHLSQESDRETWRAIVLRQQGAEVLLTATVSGFRLPSLEIPRWRRLAEQLTSAMKAEWGCDAICLAVLDGSTAHDGCEPTRYAVMEFWSDTRSATDRAEWIPGTSVGPQAFEDNQDYLALRQALEQCSKPPAGAAGPFAKPGWFAELRAWIAEAIRPYGLELRNSFCQFNASPTFSLIRFETSGPAVWFKAVGEPNLREFTLTPILAKLFAGSIPHIFAARSAWNAWLAWDVEGASLGHSREVEHWKSAATAFANVQIASISYGRELLQCGARDLRLPAISESIEPFFAVMAHLMERQSQCPPAILGHAELLCLEKQLKSAFSLVADLRIPDTLGHPDLNPENVLRTRQGWTFLDWAQAFVGFGCVSFEYFLEHFRHAVDADAAVEAELRECYWKPWRAVIPSICLTELQRAAPLLAVFAYAVQGGFWTSNQKVSEGKAAGYLRSLTRRMKLEADQFSAHRATSALHVPKR